MTNAELLEATKDDSDLIVLAETSIEAEEEAKKRFLAVGVTRAVREESGSLRNIVQAASVYTLPGDGGHAVVLARYDDIALDTFGAEEYFDLQFVAAAQHITADKDQLVREHPQSVSDLPTLQPWLSAGLRAALPGATATAESRDRKEKIASRNRVRTLRSFARYGYETSDFAPTLTRSCSHKDDIEVETADLKHRHRGETCTGCTPP